MPRFLYILSAWILRKALSLRYRVEIKNLKLLLEANYDQKGGILFLPNHPAAIDPIILGLFLMPLFQPRPLVIDHFYYLKGIHFLMKWIGAVPLPNFELSMNTWKVHQVEKSLEIVKTSLKKGENFLIYPSGHLKTDGREIIGGNSFVHRILETCPDVKIVLIRTTGLWGSFFSRAITGKSPDFWKVFFHGVKILLKNAVFFTPRRKVTIEFALAPKDFPYKKSRVELNQYLENWYNQYRDASGYLRDREPLNFVSLSCFKRDFPVTQKEEIKKVKKEIEVPQSIRNLVTDELAKISGINAKEIQETMSLSRDLGLDSLDLAGMQVFLDQQYDLPQAINLEKIQTVADLLELILEGKEDPPIACDLENEEFDKWSEESFRPPVQFPKGETIQEVFFRSCERMKRAIACGDEIIKTVSYHQLKTKTIVLARHFQKLPDTHIAVLLPSSVGAFLLILAILVAGKIPVILNWTSGVRSLNFANQLLNLKTVVSARHFLERVDHLDLGALESKLVLIEEFRRELSFWDKLFGLFLAHKKASFLMKFFRINHIKPQDPAVVLFTSGTESYPKAVPLSHHNLIENQKAALSVVKINPNDILLGALPPFHSFGFSVTGLFPLLSGLRVFFSPDPTDSQKIAHDCARCKITILCLAPSFYRNLFRIATFEQLKSVRMFVTGAERAPEELLKDVKKLGENKILIEGYGITECSPIVTLCRIGDLPKGVGKAIPGVSLCIIHPETKERLLDQEQGEICIKGPNVFRGYLGKDVPNPFIEIEGERWYRSGDLGRLDRDGSLFCEGRFRRFVKIGGEMVSLVALEEELTYRAKEKGWISKEEDSPQLAIGVSENGKEKAIFTLFTTFSVSEKEINRALRESGFARIIKIQAVKKISEIPLTGAGKVHFHRINEMLKT